MLLEAWHNDNKWLHLDDSKFDNSFCDKRETNINVSGLSAQQVIISMRDCFIIYGNHKLSEKQIIKSRQDSDIAIMSFQLNGQLNVNEKDYQPYRIFDNDVHITFYTNKRELIFEAPSVMENFRVILSPFIFQELLAKYHGRFSLYSEKINKSEYFNLFETPLPITAKMKIIIMDILRYKINDSILAKVFFQTKITELFGCQLEQIFSVGESSSYTFTENDRQKIIEAHELLISNMDRAPLSINQLSRLISTNENKLKKGFKEIYGKSIYNYLLIYKIERAIEMMEDGSKSIDEIAERTGYSDASHFSRAFRKVKGVPPGQYRRSFNSK